MLTGKQIADKAYSYHNSGIPYSKWDCQAFVEQVIIALGQPCAYRGSNHMYRDMVYDIQPMHNDAEPGELLFTVKRDGNEPSYYYDGINACHVGIYTGLGKGAMHSSSGGVQEIDSASSRWTHRAKIKGVLYNQSSDIVPSGYTAQDAVNDIKTIINRLEE